MPQKRMFQLDHRGERPAGCVEFLSVIFLLIVFILMAKVAHISQFGWVFLRINACGWVAFCTFAAMNKKLLFAFTLYKRVRRFPLPSFLCKPVCLFFFLSLCSVGAAAQSVVRGVVRDSLSGEAVPYATVRLFAAADATHAVALALTDSAGFFTVQPVPRKGAFRLQISFVGKRSAWRAVTATGRDTLRVGTILMTDAGQLRGAGVVARRPLLKMETDKMTYRVADDADAPAQNLLEMLRKVPTVVVDGQDNITVKGSSAYKVYVDGKPSPLFAQNPSLVMKSVPAVMVKEVEVITNPGAKYEADGAAVINIVLKHAEGANSLNGLYGTARLQGGNLERMASASLGGKQGRWDYSANVSYQNNDVRHVRADVSRRDFAGADTVVTGFGNRSHQTNKNLMASLALGYAADSLNQLNLTASLWAGHDLNRGSQSVTLAQTNYTESNRSSARSPMFTVGADYRHNFGSQQGSSLTLSYQFSLSPSRTRGDNAPRDTLLAALERHSRNTSHVLQHVGQLDYALPLGKNHELSFGGKYTHRNSRSTTTGTAEAQNYHDLYDIAAGYGEWNGTFGPVKVRGGLRFEQTWEAMRLGGEPSQHVNSHFSNWVPSASLSYVFSPVCNLGFTYAMRVSRPGISYLNPYVVETRPTERQYGNPDLDVDKIHSFGLVLNRMSAKLMLNVGMHFLFSNDGIEQYSFYRDGLLNTTYGNVSRLRQVNAGAFASWQMLKNTRLLVNLNGDYMHRSSHALDCSRSGWQATAFGGLEQTLPKGFAASLYGFGMSRQYQLQGYTRGFGVVVANISKKWLKDRLVASLEGVTALSHDGKLRIDSRTAGRDFTNRMCIKIPVTNFKLSLTYNFGNSALSTRRHETKIQSDVIEHKSQLETVKSGTGF